VPVLVLVAAMLATVALVGVVVLATGSGAAVAAVAKKRPQPDGRTPGAMVDLPSLGERAARTALTAVGVRYRWGGESPESGFDCSGLVRWAYLRFGVDLPHSSYALFDEGRRVARGHMEPGDVLFFEGLGHVGLYLGEGRMVHAPETGREVEVVALARSSYGGRLVGARRVVPG
jgi:cell wall-associated NlpC family hydrolase